MCMCGKPTINGQPGYCWDGKTRGVYPVNPPGLAPRDSLLYDEPGRCGGLDSHSYHFRLVKASDGGIYLLVRHGGGDERIRLGTSRPGLAVLANLDSNGRYWLLQMFYHAHQDGVREAEEQVAQTYRQAFVEGRLRKRKIRGTDSYKVEIKPRDPEEQAIVAKPV